MGSIHLWLGPAGAGKTRRALQMLQTELAGNWRGTRYLVPTVGHKQSLERYLLEGGLRRGLAGDPVTTFFNFAEEVATRAYVSGRALSELQKYLLLQQLIHATPTQYFGEASRFPGFVLALRDVIDELKVHMVTPEALASAAAAANSVAPAMAQKLTDLAALYAQYQTAVGNADLYDNEGIMWIAAERLRDDPALCAELRCLILDGFARLTPIQIEFLRVLAQVVPRIIVLFDYEDGRADVYHPVELSLNELEQCLSEHTIERHWYAPRPCTPSALGNLQTELFRPVPSTCVPDASLGLLMAATPAQEADLIAREIRHLLARGRLEDGTPVTPADIAVMARSPDALRPHLSRSFARVGLPLAPEPPSLAHTAVGRALLAACRLITGGWGREEVLLLLRSGMLALSPTMACAIDLIAHAQALRAHRRTWLDGWPDEGTRQALREALSPLVAFEETITAPQVDLTQLLEGVRALVRTFRCNRVSPTLPFPDLSPTEAPRYVELEAAFAHTLRVLDSLESMAPYLGHLHGPPLLDVLRTALTRETLTARASLADGVAVHAVHATGGEKFKVVFLADMREGHFPRHQQESPFLMDHERLEALPAMQVHLVARKHLEQDEPYWFIHALRAASHRAVLSFAQCAADGTPLEHSCFLDAVGQVVPAWEALLGRQLGEEATALPPGVYRQAFGDVAPPLRDVACEDDYLAALAIAVRTEREPAARLEVAAAYTAWLAADHVPAALARLFQRTQRFERAPHAPSALAALATLDSGRRRPLSASELQAYADCPFLWFTQYALRLTPLEEEFSPLDRGKVVHGVLETLFRQLQPHPEAPVHLEALAPEELEILADPLLLDYLMREPRFHNRPAVWREVEAEILRRAFHRFLVTEYHRALTRGVHPLWFEWEFGSDPSHPCMVGRGWQIRGTLDRVDVADADPHQALIVDYKTSTGELTTRELLAGQMLQVPLYALALNRSRDLHVIGVELLDIRQGGRKGVYRDGASAHCGRVSEQSEADWQAYLAKAEARIDTLAHALAAGAIALTPTTRRCPELCAYQPICRGARFALARAVRQARGDA
jgi:ATP-dependent helicase/DNAse subunit B